LQNWWTTNVQFLKGVGPSKATLLAKLGIVTIADLLEHYPRRYEDRSQLKPIQLIEHDTIETFRGLIVSVEETKPRRGLTITKLVINDDSGIARLVWFNQPYIKKKLKIGEKLIVTGKVKRQFNQVEVANPEVELIDGQDMLHTGRIVPIYPANENINQKFLRVLIRQILDNYGAVPENMPVEVIQQFNLLDRSTALVNIHFPVSNDLLAQARYRLVFEELYLLQCGLALLRKQNRQVCVGIKHAPDGQLLKMIATKLPFTLTTDQHTVLNEIKADMEDVTPMQRLLQGDVGSGKTVVAAIALAKTVENGYQGAMMAPTEILAEQHYHTLARLLAPFGMKIGVLSGKLTRRCRENLLSQINKGIIDIVVGTHALIQEDVVFKNLGLVITDEQHRFGVRQRAKLQEKGNMPDVLVMTATPIPRTMALTVYGDLDVSVIRQLPPGRKPIKTFVRGLERRTKVYEFIIEEIRKGRQAYVVCPLVEESEKIDAQSAVKLFEQLATTVFTGFSCGLVHGKLKPQEKDEVMAAFYRGEIKVLIATTVIEVGVNVPNATIMVIEGADRFGLAQLHQLRGRIGRGEHQSYCILLSGNTSQEAKQRLEILANTNDGFVLAEEDLKLRGPGQFFGTRQHGLPDLKIADVINDIDILLDARRAAQQTVNLPEQVTFVYDFFKQRFGEHFREMFCS